MNAKMIAGLTDGANINNLKFADIKEFRFAFATNGNAVRSFDLVAGTTSDVEFMHFPTPQELKDLLALTDDESPLEKRCRDIPFLSGARYYQERAVEGVVKALGRGKKNALITLATVTRAFRAEKTQRSKAALTGERKNLLGVIMENYVRDGVWTLTAESFRDLLMQRYASLGGAYAALGFRSTDEAMVFYGDIQRELYAA